MDITVDIDDTLLADAEEYTGIKDTAALVNEAVKALVEREAARALARMGGSDPEATLAPRRRIA